MSWKQHAVINNDHFQQAHAPGVIQQVHKTLNYWPKATNILKQRLVEVAANLVCITQNTKRKDFRILNVTQKAGSCVYYAIHGAVIER